MRRLVCAMFCVVCSTALSARADGPTTLPTSPVVYLAAPGQFPSEYECPLLIRELARQAFLIAARDEMGLYTRDGVLREWEPTADGSPPVDALGKPMLVIDPHWDFNHRKLNARLFTLGKDKVQIGLMPISVPFDKQAWASVADCLINCEPLSRGKDVELLKSLGYEGHAKPVCNDPLPDSIDRLLYETTLLPAFSAIQQTHALIRNGGESPARLGALVRGYANLGLLTRFQWSSIHKVMTARSLLYAQRMVNEDPNSPVAYYHRAYAYTFAGLHAAALADLAKAAALHDATPADALPTQVPGWVRLLEPTCKYDTIGLVHGLANTDRRTPLATLLVFVDTQNCGSVSRLVETGDAALQSNPGCFSIIDAMVTHVRLGTANQLSESAPQIMLDTIRADINRLSPVPASVQQAMAAMRGADERVSGLTALCSSFMKTTEPAEPSFAVAGRILQETNFMHEMRRAYFLRDWWGMDNTDFVHESAPLIETHPLKLYVQSLALPKGARGEAIKSMDVIDPQIQMLEMMRCTASMGKLPGRMMGQIGFSRIYSNLDGCAYDEEPVLLPYEQWNEHPALVYAQRILEVSPYSPAAVAKEIRLDWEHVQPRMDEWAKRYDDEPAVLFSLGTEYVDSDQIEKGEAVLSHLVEIAPDLHYCLYLSDVYLNEGDEEKWLKTLKTELAQPDSGLDHCNVRCRIAWHYMETGRYGLARPFADEALSESGSEQAMRAASYAAEYVGDYVTAEKIRKEETARYDTPAWFNWCKRTGRGDLASAKKSADAWVTARLSINDPSSYDEIGQVYFLEDRLADARRCFVAAMKYENSAYDALRAADTCLVLKDSQGRKDALQYAVDHCNKNKYDDDNSALVGLAKLLLDAGDGMPTKEAYNDYYNKGALSAEQWSEAIYFRGRQFEIAGDKEKTIDLYQHVIQQNHPDLFTYTLACDALHKMGQQTELFKVPASQPVKKPD